MLKIESAGEKTVTITRLINGPRETVFRAYTDPDLMVQWYGADDWPLTHVESDLRSGGKYRLVWTKRGGQKIAVSGTWLSVRPPEKLIATEIFDEDWTGGETRVVTSFEDQGDKTLVIIEITYSSEAARDGALATPMADGMESGFVKLDALMEKMHS